MQSSTLSILAAGLAVGGLLLGLLNFRFLLYPLIPRIIPVKEAKQLELTGPTLFISDLHLRNGVFKFAEDLRAFVQEEGISNLVIVGDLFQSPEDFEAAAEHGISTLTVLGLDGFAGKAFWILGSPGHDPEETDAMDAYSGLVVLGSSAWIRLGNVKVLGYHGHDLSVVGAFGHGWSRFLDHLGLERLWKRFARVDESSWVVFGHTHVPGVDGKHLVANCGGWQRIPFLVQPAGTGILFLPDEFSPKLVRIMREWRGLR